MPTSSPRGGAEFGNEAWWLHHRWRSLSTADLAVMTDAGIQDGACGLGWLIVAMPSCTLLAAGWEGMHFAHPAEEERDVNLLEVKAARRGLDMLAVVRTGMAHDVEREARRKRLRGGRGEVGEQLTRSRKQRLVEMIRTNLQA